MSKFDHRKVEAVIAKNLKTLYDRGYEIGHVWVDGSKVYVGFAHPPRKLKGKDGLSITGRKFSYAYLTTNSKPRQVNWS